MKKDKLNQALTLAVAANQRVYDELMSDFGDLLA